MKFRMQVHHEGDAPGAWWENYDKETDDPQAWAEATVARFNRTLRPHELPRVLVKVEVGEFPQCSTEGT